MTTEKITELEKTLAKCKIKEANGIDYSSEITDALQAFASESSDKNNILQDNHRSQRWQYGLSLPSNPDIKHDTEKLMEYAELLNKESSLPEDIFFKLYESITAVIDDSEEKSNNKNFFDVIFSDYDIISEFLEPYDFSESLKNNMKKFYRLCMLFVDIADENKSNDYIYAKLSGHGLSLLASLDCLNTQMKKESAK